MKKDVTAGSPGTYFSPEKFTQTFLGKSFDGGFKIDYVKNAQDQDMDYTINGTMMRIDLAKQLKSGENVSFKIKWWYNIPNHTTDRARSGFEPFEDGNNNYVIAQFFPRMAVYNDVEGWQNLQFLGRGEFTLVFGIGHVDCEGVVRLEHIFVLREVRGTTLGLCEQLVQARQLFQVHSLLTLI